MQVYGVLCDADGNFLIAVKRTNGYFFWNNKTKRGRLNPSGLPALNGAGKYALPGGGKGAEEPIAKGASRELTEETAVNIPIDARVHEHTFTVADDTFAAGYFLVGSGELRTLAGMISDNLVAAGKVASKVQDRSIKAYDEIFEQFPECPQDNELMSVQIWNVKQDWAKIALFKTDPDLDWYYEILAYLKGSLVK